MVVNVQFPVPGDPVINSDYMKRLLLFLLLIAIPIFADTSGTINFTYYNATTGLFGSTINTCNATADCLGAGPVFFGCFLDYDGNAVSGTAGWCNLTSITKCYHDSAAYDTGTYLCTSNTTYRQCSSGVWGTLSTCSSGTTCAGGSTSCSTSSSGSGSGAGSQANVTANLTRSITFSSSPSDFSIVQGNFTQKNATVKNNGNFTLYNITLSVSGIPWYAVSPAKVNSLSINGETTFKINFTIPENAEAKTYQVTLFASNHNASATASRTVNVAVTPSEKTAQDVIIPDYGKYGALLSELQANLTRLQNSGANVENATNLLLNAQSKLKQVDSAIQSKDYATAVAYLDDAKGLLNAAAAEMLALQPPPFHIDPVVLVIILAVIGAAAFVVYLILPPKEEKSGLGDYFNRRKRK